MKGFCLFVFSSKWSKIALSKSCRVNVSVFNNKCEENWGPAWVSHVWHRDLYVKENSGKYNLPWRQDKVSSNPLWVLMVDLIMLTQDKLTGEKEKS